MSWFYKLKMINKLMLGIGFMAAGLCLVGYMGLHSMTRINDRLERMHSLDFLGVTYFRNVELGLRAINRSLSSAIDASNRPEIEKYVLDVRNHNENLRKEIDQGKRTATTGDEKVRFAEIDKTYTELMGIIGEAVNLAQGNRDKEAIDILNIGATLSDKMDRAVEDLIKKKLDASAQGQKEAQAIYRKTQSLMLSVIIVTLGVASLLGYRVAVMITKAPPVGCADAESCCCG